MMKIDNKSSDQREKKIIDDYWCFNEEQIKFVEAVKVVADRYGMTTHSLSNLVQKNSTCSIYCKSCEKLQGTYKKRSDVKLNLFILFEGVFCNRCGQKHRVQSQRDSKERKFEYMRDAITNQVWKSLTPYELSILAFVAKNEGRQKILNRAVFSFPKNRQAEQWDILNGFNRRHLMYIEQDEKNKSILHIHVHGDLYQTLKTDYPNLFTFENRDPQVLQPLTFVANENKLEETDNQPDYSGFIDSFPAEVVICPEKSYNYGVWKRKDGSLFIKLEPLSESLTQYYKKK